MNFYRILSVEMRKFDIFLTVSNPFSWQKMEYFNIFGLLWQKRRKNLRRCAREPHFCRRANKNEATAKRKEGRFVARERQAEATLQRDRNRLFLPKNAFFLH